jgi:hypothetical protein
VHLIEDRLVAAAELDFNFPPLSEHSLLAERGRVHLVVCDLDHGRVIGGRHLPDSALGADARDLE